MQSPHNTIKDGNDAAASVAYRLSETIAIYPITPSSGMAESCDEWSSQSKPNLWGSVPRVMQMQSEAGAAGAVHGMLQGGTLTTTFTASQGLLLMIPNMYKIAGELLPFCMHVTARSLATHALSIFGDHSDVMACRQTGFALLASNTVQEAQDMAAIGHLATLESRVPFLHFFDGFRTSHEINTLTHLSDAELQQLVDAAAVEAFRSRALTPDNPSVRGTAQNPDVFFQAREAANRIYSATPGIVQGWFERFKAVTGRSYQLFEYLGHPEAEHVVVAMGSACETIAQVVRRRNEAGERCGLLKVRLYRPWDQDAFARALPPSTRSIAVLDRTKEPGALGEPLFLDVVAGVEEARVTGNLPDAFAPQIIGGRYGLGSKEFSPAMVEAIYGALQAARPQRRFTVGITDDVTGLSLAVDDNLSSEPPGAYNAIFYGIGSDGTVGANKNTIKIIGSETPNFAQGYFVYDSKKSGGLTVSHLRFGPEPIQAPYLIEKAEFVACHQFSLLERYDLLERAAPGATFLLNTSFAPDQLWDQLPRSAQEHILEKQLKVYVVDAYAVAKNNGLGARINTVMQTCFFAICGLLPRDEAIAKIKEAIAKTYGRKGQHIVDRNNAGVDASVAELHTVEAPSEITSERTLATAIEDTDPDFIKRVTAVMLANQGDRLPVSAFPIDGVWPTGTTRYEKRNIAQEIPQWEPDLCIQCNKCAFVCPHAAIRAKRYPERALSEAPEGFQSTAFKSREQQGLQFTIQVAPEDCTGCNLCVAVCPATDRKDKSRKAINMVPQRDIRERERQNFRFFLGLPEPSEHELGNTVKDSQFRKPLFEFSGACAGCGETPYIKTLTQMYGDRLMIANATGCSSIFGGNLPTTPYTVDNAGRGPAWANSLFEDNAEFGLGLKLALEHKNQRAKALLERLQPKISQELSEDLLKPTGHSASEITLQRDRVRVLREWLAQQDSADARELNSLADYLVEKALWIIGGDGWAYDIGYGGLDHVLASGENVNILVLDSGTYSNTGGQASKATPTGAVAKFAMAGKSQPRKNLGLQALMYGNIYVAQIALGAKDSQTVTALVEAQNYPGPSLVIAYAHCISHGYQLCNGLEHQKNAVDAGAWPLFRYNPQKETEGQAALKLDSRGPKLSMIDFMATEGRFQMLQRQDPERAELLARQAEAQARQQFELLTQMAKPTQAVAN